MNRTLIAIVVFLFGTTLTFVDVKDWIAAEFPAVAPYLFLLKYVGVVLLALLALLAVIELIGWIVEASVRLMPSTQANLALRPVKADDLPLIVEIANKQIGPQITLESTTKLYRHNPKSIRKIVNIKCSKTVGYFCVLPLTRKGEEQVKQRDLIGVEQDLSCFAKTFRKHSPVYIGSIAAEGLRPRAGALELLKSYLISKEVTKAYARPATRHGVRLVKRHKFKAVSGFDRIEEGVYVIRAAEFV
jgi:hypothetical protein